MKCAMTKISHSSTFEVKLVTVMFNEMLAKRFLSTYGSDRAHVVGLLRAQPFPICGRGVVTDWSECTVQ